MKITRWGVKFGRLPALVDFSIKSSADDPLFVLNKIWTLKLSWSILAAWSRAWNNE